MKEQIVSLNGDGNLSFSLYPDKSYEYYKVRYREDGVIELRPQEMVDVAGVDEGQGSEQNVLTFRLIGGPADGQTVHVNVPEGEDPTPIFVRSEYRLKKSTGPRGTMYLYLWDGVENKERVVLDLCDHNRDKSGVWFRLNNREDLVPLNTI